MGNSDRREVRKRTTRHFRFAGAGGRGSLVLGRFLEGVSCCVGWLVVGGDGGVGVGEKYRVFRVV